jgi:5-formyltetrahydrofolate cyclo-ligase
MEMRRYLGVESLVEGAFHILEPMGELLADYSELDLILVPGMAFDLSCHRLGRGRGYYDCFLHRCSHKTWRIGYCFPFQMLDKVSVEPHDEQVNECISL